jgi:hypothetical protein
MRFGEELFGVVSSALHLFDLLFTTDALSARNERLLIYGLEEERAKDTMSSNSTYLQEA